MSHLVAPSRRTFLAGSAMTALAMTLAACGANESSSGNGAAATSTTKGGTLRVLTTSQDFLWDPATSQSLATTSLAWVHRRLTSWVIAPGKEPTVVADLATDTGTVSEDGLTWTYTLKPGLVNSQGEPITSAQIRHGLERSFADSLAGGLSYHKTLLAGTEGYTGPYEGQHLDSIETPDDSTIIFHLARPYADWPWVASMPAFAPVPENDDPTTFAKAPVASGPYKVTDYQQGVRVTLERNEYWDEATDEVRTALPDTIICELGQDSSTIAQRLISDSGDDRNAFGSIQLTAAQLAQINGNPNAKERVATSDPGPLSYMAINVERVSDRDVRRAIAQAVNKDAVVAAYGGELGAAPASTYITPGIPGYEKYDLYPHDVQAAQATLSQVTVSPLILLVQNREADVAVAQAVAQSLTEVGLQVTIDPVEPQTFHERANHGDGSTYDLALYNWNPDYPSANANIQPLYASSEIGNGGMNVSRYSNPEVDAAIEEAIVTTDPAQAKAQWQAIDKLIAEDVPAVPLVYRRNSYLRGSGVTNFFVNDFPAYANYLVIGVNAA